MIRPKRYRECAMKSKSPSTPNLQGARPTFPELSKVIRFFSEIVFIHVHACMCIRDHVCTYTAVCLQHGMHLFLHKRGHPCALFFFLRSSRRLFCLTSDRPTPSFSLTARWLLVLRHQEECIHPSLRRDMRPFQVFTVVNRAAWNMAPACLWNVPCAMDSRNLRGRTARGTRHHTPTPGGQNDALLPHHAAGHGPGGPSGVPPGTHSHQRAKAFNQLDFQMT